MEKVSLKIGILSTELCVTFIVNEEAHLQFTEFTLSFSKVYFFFKAQVNLFFAVFQPSS